MHLATTGLQVISSLSSATLRTCPLTRRLFLDELQLLQHLEALRRAFFMGAGDWADAFMATLGAHADSLEPLSQHTLERMLQDAVRVSA
jgi:hypothetical protein